MELVWRRKRRRLRGEIRAEARKLLESFGPTAIEYARRDLYMPGLSEHLLLRHMAVYREVLRRVASPTEHDLDGTI